MSEAHGRPPLTTGYNSNRMRPNGKSLTPRAWRRWKRPIQKTSRAKIARRLGRADYPSRFANRSTSRSYNQYSMKIRMTGNTIWMAC